MNWKRGVVSHRVFELSVYGEIANRVPLCHPDRVINSGREYNATISRTWAHVTCKRCLKYKLSSHGGE